MKIALRKKILLVCCVAATITGCSTVGLGSVPQTRENYNLALDTSENEQFLLNLVRMHYGETPYYVSVNSIVAATTLSYGGQVNLGQSNAPSVNNGFLWKFSPQISFTQTPTITYSPIQGSKFVSGMIAPLTMDKIYMLLRSGYGFSEVLKLTLSRVGNLDNGALATRVGLSTVPDTSKYDKFASDLVTSDQHNLVFTALTQYESKPAIMLYIRDTAAAQQISRDLGFSKTYSKIVLADILPLPEANRPENVLSVKPRSFFSIVNILSKNVNELNKAAPQTPAALVEDEEYNATLASTTTNWTNLTHNLLTVQASPSTPSNVLSKIKYNGTWYFIGDDDKTSIATFVLLKLIYTLQMGEVSANLPLITIPVAN